MTETVPLLNSNTTSKGNNSNALIKLEQYLKEKRCSCCYNTRPLSDAEIINVREIFAYVLHLWTLIENRWTTQEIAPYHGDETCPSQPVGDIWRDYQFNSPKETILSDGKAQYADRHLVNSQRKERCTKCDCQGEIQCEKCKGYGHIKCVECKEQGQIECCKEEICQKCSGKGSYICSKCIGHGKYDCLKCLSHGQVQCPQCKGYRFVVIWTRLHVKWFNAGSIVSYIPYVRCKLPNSKIENTSDKVTCLVYDNVWSSAIESIDNILNTCVGIPDECRNKINERYQNEHCKKTGEILRVNCIIQRLKIKEFEYKLNKINDEIFTFCLYGEDEREVYDNQYPYRYCGLRCSSYCILM